MKSIQCFLIIYVFHEFLATASYYNTKIFRPCTRPQGNTVLHIVTLQCSPSGKGVPRVKTAVCGDISSCQGAPIVYTEEYHQPRAESKADRDCQHSEPTRASISSENNTRLCTHNAHINAQENTQQNARPGGCSAHFCTRSVPWVVSLRWGACQQTKRRGKHTLEP